MGMRKLWPVTQVAVSKTLENKVSDCFKLPLLDKMHLEKN